MIRYAIIAATAFGLCSVLTVPSDPAEAGRKSARGFKYSHSTTWSSRWTYVRGCRKGLHLR
jgi:hypothetical protein